MKKIIEKIIILFIIINFIFVNFTYAKNLTENNIIKDDKTIENIDNNKSDKLNHKQENEVSNNINENKFNEINDSTTENFNSIETNVVDNVNKSSEIKNNNSEIKDKSDFNNNKLENENTSSNSKKSLNSNGIVDVEQNKVQSTKISSGLYEIEVGTNSNCNIEVSCASLNSGANVQIYKKNDAMCQKVEIQDVGNGYYTIKFRHSRKYLDVAYGGQKDGTNVWQCTENGLDPQKWLIQDIGDGYCKIISKCNNKYLTVHNSSSNYGSNIEICSEKNDNSQKFKLNKIEKLKGNPGVLKNGVYEIVAGTNNHKAIDVAGNSNLSGANVEIYERNDLNCQRVFVKEIENGFYTLQFVNSGKYLDVYYGLTAEHTNVWQCSGNGADAQKWVIRKTDDGYYQIISKCSETYLTIENGGRENLTNIEINGYKGDSSQKFRFIPENKTIEKIQSLNDGIYEIETGVNSNKAIEVSSASLNSLANVQIFQKNGAMCQSTEIKYVGNGYYTIKFRHSKMFLDVAYGRNNNYANVGQCTENGLDPQKWIIQDVGNGYYKIISKCNNKYLTVENGRDNNCTNISMYGETDDNSQLFKLNKKEPLTGTKTIEDGIYEIATKIDENKVLDVKDASNLSGANVQIYDNEQSKNQQVNIKYHEDGFYTFQFVHSGKYLDVYYGLTSEHTNVWQCSENGADAQKWVIRKTNDGYYQIISKCSETYLTVADGKNKNGTNVEINGNRNNNSQKFSFITIENNIKPTKTIEDGMYEIRAKIDNDKVVEVYGASGKSGANVQIFSSNNALCQRVIVKYIGDGYYTIKFRHSGMFLDVAYGGQKNGTNIWQCTENGLDPQKWIIQDAGNGYYKIISKCNEKYMTIHNGKNQDGTNIEVCSNKNDNSQLFRFASISTKKGTKTIDDGIYEIETANNSNEVLDVVDGNLNSGANVQIYSKNDAGCQKIKVEYVGNGYYTLKFTHSGKYLDVAYGNTAEHTNVWQCTGNGLDPQKWIIEDAGDGYYRIISKCSESYLTVADNGYWNGANIEINGCKQNNSQKFKFNKTNLKSMKGIDVSAHNGTINWDRVKNSGIDFAIIRCGFGSDLSNQDDIQFQRNIQECERLKIPYGVYIYSYALDENGAYSEADHVLRMVKGCKPELGIWYDMEDADNYRQRHGMPSNQALVNMCKIFCNKINDNGYNAGIYASLNWFKTKLNDDSLDIYPKWVAQWAPACTYTKRYIMWQYTDTGNVEGIYQKDGKLGNVDMDEYYF